MRFCSVFLLSNFLIFGFPLAVQKEENSDALRESDRALSARDDVVASATLPVSLNTDDPGLTGLDPGSGSSLLAQTTNEAPGWGLGHVESVVNTAGAMFDVLGNRVDHVGDALGDDYPTNVKVTFPSMGLRKEGAAQGASNPGQTPGKQEGADPERAIEKQEGTGAATGDEGSRPLTDYLALKIIAWCDYGHPWSFIKAGKLLNVKGYACMFFS